MSGLVYSRTDSGLLVGENATSDERAVARALKEYDPDLRLVPQGFRDGRTAYKVYRYCGSERPAEFICFWGNAEGEPYPLSQRLIERVQALDKNARGSSEYLTEDELNARVRAEQTRHAEEVAEELAADWRRRDGRSAMLPRTTNRGNSRWKERQFQAQKLRLRGSR